MTDGRTEPPRKLSRQQARAKEREKRDAQSWITELGTSDPWMKQSIRRALGNRHVTRAELEVAIGVSLAPDPESLPSTAVSPAPPAREPDHITIQHILISFAGAGTKATRTREAASTLASETLDRARQGEDFGELVVELTDDSAPGVYALANTDVAPRSGDVYPRGRMVSAFGDVGFRLAVGEIGMAPHDAKSSPYGWHIITRLQ